MLQSTTHTTLLWLLRLLLLRSLVAFPAKAVGVKAAGRSAQAGAKTRPWMLPSTDCGSLVVNLARSAGNSRRSRRHRAARAATAGRWAPLRHQPRSAPVTAGSSGGGCPSRRLTCGLSWPRSDRCGGR